MIGAMPAVAVRHERRKNKKDHPDAEPGLLHGPSKNVRPKRGNLLLKSRLTSPPSATAASGLSSGAGGTAATAATASLAPISSCGNSHLLRAPPPSSAAAADSLVTGGSLASSRVGSPVAADPAVVLMYGDECCYAKVSLLHFIVFFFLGGITVMIIGAVQVNEFILSQWPSFHTKKIHNTPINHTEHTSV